MIQVLLTIRASRVEPTDGSRVVHRATVLSEVVKREHASESEDCLAKRLSLHGQKPVFADQLQNEGRVSSVTFPVRRGRCWL